MGLDSPEFTPQPTHQSGFTKRH